MISDGNKILVGNIWKPSMSFFRKGFSFAWNPLLKDTGRVQWKFSKVSCLKSPVSFVQCTMTGFGIEAKGFGDCFLIKNSMIQAFAESWERLWMHLLGMSSSNGFAAAESVERSLIQSKYELIERTLFLEAWQQQVGWQLYQLTNWKSRILKKYLEGFGWKSRFFLIADEILGCVLVGLAQHPDQGAICDAVYVDRSHSTGDSESKLLRSLIRVFLRNLNVEKMNHFQMPEEGEPNDHTLFYSHPENNRAFSFLNHRESQQGILNIGHSQNIESHIVVEADQLPAVAVAYNSAWPKLCWGKQSIRGKNQWPHPLA